MPKPGADGQEDPKTPKAGDGGEGSNPGGDGAADPKEGGAAPAVDETKWDESTRNYIKSLRDESAKHRNKAKDLQKGIDKLNTDLTALKGGLQKALGGSEDDGESLEDKLKNQTAQSEQMAFRLAVMESAFEHGFTSKDQVEYFEFLVQKAGAGLKDEEEISDEAMSEIVTKVKAFSKPGSSGGKGPTSPKGGGTPPPADGNGGQAITVEAFAAMSVSERSLLYAKDPANYSRLMDAVQQKKMLR